MSPKLKENAIAAIMFGLLVFLFFTIFAGFFTIGAWAGLVTVPLFLGYLAFFIMTFDA